MGMVFRRKYKDKTGQIRQCHTWTIRYNRNGKQFEESTGAKLKTKAQALLKRREGDIERGLPVQPTLYRVTFDDAIKAVIDDQVDNGRRCLDDVETRINLHLKPFFTGMRLASITTDLVLRYRVTRKEEGAAPATINREVGVLKRAFRLAHRAGNVTTIPYLPMVAEQNTRQGFFEPDEFKDVVSRLPSCYQPVARFAQITGWRWVSEILPLTWSQVDFDAEEVRLEPGTTKNGEGRTFPFTKELKSLLEGQRLRREALKEEGRICPFVFEEDGHEIAEGSYVKAWRKARKAAGLPGRLMHDLRRTAVRELVRAGVPEQVAMRMTGHKTRSVFERYNIVSGGDLKEAAKKLDERAATVTSTAISGTQSHPIPANSTQARIMPIAQGRGA